MGKKLINFLLNIVLLLICGLSVGWIMGLSISPIAHIVIGSLMGVIVVVLSLQIGISYNNNHSLWNIINLSVGSSEEDEKKRRINIYPIAIIFIGLIFGSSLGIFARTNDWFGLDIDKEAQFWNDRGQKKQQIYDAIFEWKYNVSSDLNEQLVNIKTRTFLFSVPSNFCNLIEYKYGEILRTHLILLGDKKIKYFAENCKDSLALHLFKETLCLDQ